MLSDENIIIFEKKLIDIFNYIFLIIYFSLTGAQQFQE